MCQIIRRKGLGVGICPRRGIAFVLARNLHGSGYRSLLDTHYDFAPVPAILGPEKTRFHRMSMSFRQHHITPFFKLNFG
jgi:hypothetical protein